MITLLYFASLREQLGVARESVPSESLNTIADLVELLYARGGLWPHLLGAANIQIARNQLLVHDRSEPIAADDEIAFLPPVTGG